MAVRHLPQDLHHQVLPQETQPPAHRQVGRGGELAEAKGEHNSKYFQERLHTPVTCAGGRSRSSNRTTNTCSTTPTRSRTPGMFLQQSRTTTWQLHSCPLQLDLRPLLQGTFDTSKPRKDTQRRKALCLRVVREKLSSARVLSSPQVSEFLVALPQ